MKVTTTGMPSVKSLHDGSQTTHRITERETFGRLQTVLNCYGAEGDHFLERMVTGNETWTHHYESESKQDLRDCLSTADRQLDVTVRAWLVFHPKTFF
jgi:hypothetical protein